MLVENHTLYFLISKQQRRRKSVVTVFRQASTSSASGSSGNVFRDICGAAVLFRVSSTAVSYSCVKKAQCCFQIISLGISSMRYLWQKYEAILEQPLSFFHHCNQVNDKLFEYPYRTILRNKPLLPEQFDYFATCSLFQVVDDRQNYKEKVSHICLLKLSEIHLGSFGKRYRVLGYL